MKNKLIFLGLILVGGLVIVEHGALGAFWNTFFGPGPKQFQEALMENRLPLEGRSYSAVAVPEKVNGDQFALPNAHAAYVMDASTEDTLYQANEHDHRQVASLTKVMTALLLMQSGRDLNDVVTVDAESINRTGTKIGCANSTVCNGQPLVPGEKIRLYDLLQAMLMNSANETAVLIAKSVAGDEKTFVDQMNAKVADLQLHDTHFCTANGLEPDDHATDCYSSAYDMAHIVKEALKYPELWDIMRQESHPIYSADGTVEHMIYNTDQILGQDPRLLGAKTGFTPLAGYSLLSAAKDGDHTVIAVLLDDPIRWDDIRSVFDWSYTAFKWI